MIKIKDICGYKLSYDDRRQLFVIEDVDGTELAHAATQNEAEAKAKTLSKQEFKRVPIMETNSEGQIVTGELTSLNRDDQSAWVSMEKRKYTYGSGRQKINLRYSTNYYEVTETNTAIAEKIKQQRETIDTARAEIERLRATLEKPINLEYFGLTR